jgi:hypothetical protein
MTLSAVQQELMDRYECLLTLVPERCACSEHSPDRCTEASHSETCFESGAPRPLGSSLQKDGLMFIKRLR